MAMDFLTHATRFVRLGFPVFPLAPASKVPLIPKDPERAHAQGFHKFGEGAKDATLDMALVEEWARICPTANIGLGMGRRDLGRPILLLDLDTCIKQYKGAEHIQTSGEVELLAIIRKHGVLPRAPLVRTCSGGWHMFLDGSDAPEDFKKHVDRFDPKLVDTRGKPIKIKTGIELKWDGGYAVGAPSWVSAANNDKTNKDGAYEWAPNRAPLGSRLPPPPKWFWKLFEKETYSPPPRRSGKQEPNPQKLQALVNEVLKNGPGSGNRDKILWWAWDQVAKREIADGHYTASEAYAALYDAGRQIGQDHRHTNRVLRELLKLTGGRS